MDGEHGVFLALMAILIIAVIGVWSLLQPAADAVQAVADAADKNGMTRITIGDPNRPDECGNATAVGDGACNKQVYEVSPGAAGLAFVGAALPLSLAVFFGIFVIGSIAFALAQR